MSSGSGSRHAACMECRQRKVRCDGGEPSCQNCLRRGSVCVFARNSGQDKEEMLLMISKLSDRLSHAEQRLATQNTHSRSPLPPQDVHLDHLIPDTDIDFSGFWSFPNSAGSEAVNDNTMALFAESQEFGRLPDASALVNSSEIHSLGWPSLDISQIPIGARPIPDTDSFGEELSSHSIHELYQTYFDKVDYSGYVLDKARFLARMDLLPLGPELLSLQFIVLAHGSSNSPTYRHLQNHFYDTSRKYFESAETGKTFVTIAALQACILLALYELKQLLFSRAWGRVSRAIWMAEMFGLHKMDVPSGSPRQRQSGYHLAPTSDPQELEERRRTFWSAFTVCCFTSISAGWNNAGQMDYMEITTLLPAENGVDGRTSPFRPTLQNTLRLPGARKLSRFEGLIITSALQIRSLRHADFALGEGRADYASYDFWMHHYHISECVNQVGFTQCVDPTLQTSMNELATLHLHIRIQAILICLHHAALVRESRTNSSGSPNSQSEAKCVMAALKVTDMIGQIRQHSDPDNPSPYTLWSIYVAAQFYVRAFHASGYQSTHPMMPMPTPPNLSRSPKMYANGRPSSASSGNSGQGHNKNMNMSTNRSPPSIESQASGLVPSRYELLDNIDYLLSTLSAFRGSNLISGAFEAQIYDELRGGKAITDDRPVGRVEFPLDGKYMMNDFVENGVQDIWALL